MAKNKKSTQLATEVYTFKGEHKAGICGKSGITYNSKTCSVELAESMIEKGSDVWEKKAKAAKEAK